MPDGWTPEPGAGYVGRSGTVYVGREDGLLDVAGSEPPLVMSEATAWADGPLIRQPNAARLLAAALRRDAHEAECVTGQTAGPDARDPALVDAHEAYERAEALG